jgi:hypothetical protein
MRVPAAARRVVVRSRTEDDLLERLLGDVHCGKDEEERLGKVEKRGEAGDTDAVSAASRVFTCSHFCAAVQIPLC